MDDLWHCPVGGVIQAGDFRIAKMPEASDWECLMWGGDEMGIIYRPNVNNVPNWFWRWMQFLAFGNRWRRRRDC